MVPGMPVDRAAKPFRARRPPRIGRPRSVEEIVFLPVTHLAELMQTKQVTSVELTEIYLDRLKRYGPTLNCVVTKLTTAHLGQYQFLWPIRLQASAAPLMSTAVLPSSM